MQDIPHLGSSAEDSQLMRCEVLSDLEYYSLSCAVSQHALQRRTCYFLFGCTVCRGGPVVRKYSSSTSYLSVATSYKDVAPISSSVVCRLRIARRICSNNESSKLAAHPSTGIKTIRCVRVALHCAISPGPSFLMDRCTELNSSLHSLWSKEAHDTEPRKNTSIVEKAMKAGS